jgi:hypothetical protein
MMNVSKRGCTWLFLIYLLSIKAVAASEWNKEEWEGMFKEGGAVGRISLRVLDDKGAPVAGAQVASEFYSTPKQTRITGQTDKAGLLVLEGRTISDVRFTIKKDSYYNTSQSYDFIKKATSKADAIRSGKWMPWNPTETVTLKKMRNPVPMFARQVWSVHLPCDQSVGYDLEIGDCVKPYGKGEISDLIFRVSPKKDTNGRERYLWKCSFSNSGDGIQVLEKDSWSRFPWVYEAPEGGYHGEFALPETSASGSGKSSDEQHPYLVYRVRSKADASGKITSAKYGKMNSFVLADGSREKGCRLSFGYWLNPDGTRNLEFDPNRNLGSIRRSGDDLLHQP